MFQKGDVVDVRVPYGPNQGQLVRSAVVVWYRRYSGIDGWEYMICGEWVSEIWLRRCGK